MKTDNYTTLNLSRKNRQSPYFSKTGFETKPALGKAAPLIFCAMLTAASCWTEKQADFSLKGNSGETYPLYSSSNNLSGLFDMTKTKRYDYVLSESERVPRNYSLEVDYDIHIGAEAQTTPDDDGARPEAALKIDDDFGWVLPDNLKFINADITNTRMRYVIPLQTARIKKISFEIKGGKKKSGAWLRLNGLRFTERFYGFEAEDGTVRTSPFVKEYAAGDEAETPVILINPDDYYAISGQRILFIDGISGAPLISAGNTAIQYIANEGLNEYHSLTVPAAFWERRNNAIQINGSVEKAFLKPAPPDDGMTPVIADTGFILKYPQDKWRNESYEIFFWESFPNILIFDTASYAVQDKLFKRLAFFAEKKGFKGRLARDEEIADLHGWNAHDYNAETLARFFDMAEKDAFPLLDEEIALREILIKT
ncbi:MAG: hypothetical protein LBH18_05890, partial [Spirochaetaceae bacterium]|nr:hypothetical protein [Spirochaetaceae bacterium]